MLPKIACIIPARLHSTRLPRKILETIGGKTLLQRVWEAAHSTQRFSEIVFAIDSAEAGSCIENFGGSFIMTSPACNNGTERLVELAQRKEVTADIWVNWQADSPFITKKMIDDLLPANLSLQADVWTLKKKITNDAEITTPHTVKVVSDHTGRALYFSRSPIPYQAQYKAEYFKHIGIYAYTTHALERIATMQPCALEVAEQLEQLRFLYAGLTIHAYETSDESLEINTPHDLALAQKLVQDQR